LRRNKLARRYAEAIGELAHEQGVLEEVERDLALVREALTVEPAFARVLADQNTPNDEKDRLICDTFGDRISKLALNFLRLVAAKRRGEHLEEMINEFEAYANEMRGVVEIEVTAASKLSQSQEEALVEKLSAVTGRQVRLRVKEDASLLGGVVARFGDLVMDGSVKTRLEALRDSLMRAQLN